MIKWILAIAFASVAAPLAAEDLRSADVAALSVSAATSEATNRAAAVQPGGAPDYRVLWADPAIRDFVGLGENAWDFAKPESIPGFGPLPDRADTR